MFSNFTFKVNYFVFINGSRTYQRSYHNFSIPGRAVEFKSESELKSVSLPKYLDFLSRNQKLICINIDTVSKSGYKRLYF